ncbi:helix-turn-helix transcriptional regulator [Candidatus Formimonas warabiya]|uniref:helix-turn-helix transcriptional regulator n=1 Tax=Formimonas warabiya TaxID=1761012 RepID=UPI0011D16304|nr:AraC family transcriptional regulator [Candidatus Formimonas warabiya]
MNRDALKVPDAFVVEQAMRFMERNYPKDIKLTDVAQAVYYSPCYFSRVFKELRGYGFRKYLTEIRLAQACRLLTHSDMSISEIARQVGYQDARYFSQIFKQWKGCAPTRYRLLHRRNDKGTF